MAPLHSFFWDNATRFVIGSGFAAGALWYVTPYFGPVLAQPEKAEQEAHALTRRFSSNKHMQAPVEKAA